MESWAGILLLVGAIYALVLLQRISHQLGTVEEKLGDLLTHAGVRGYDTDTDSD